MRRYLAALAVVALAMALMTMSAALPVAAQQRPPQSTAQEDTDSAQAKALFMRMADHLAEAQSFSVNMQAGYDVVQASGQKIEFGETRQILLHRPDGLRISKTSSGGDKQEILFDGKDLVFYDPDQNVFARLTRNGDVDQIVAHLVYDLDTPIPLAALLVTVLPQLMDSEIKEIAVVEETTMDGQPVTHLAARTAEVDIQTWVTTGDQPVPLRFVITYKKDPGQPQFWANLRDWDFTPRIEPSSFVFVPPAGAEEVGFMVPETAHKTKPVTGE